MASLSKVEKLAARDAAYASLGISPDDILIVVTPQLGQLRALLTRRAKALPARTKFPTSPYYYLAASGDADARKVLGAYYSLDRSARRWLPIEAYCVAARVSPLHILEVIIATAERISRQISAMIAVVTHPQLVDKSVEMALTDDGIEDRMAMHKAVGFTPSPRGAQTIINVQASAAANAAARVAELPPAETTIREMADTFNQSRGALPSADVAPDSLPACVTDAVLVEDGADDDSDED